MVGVTGMKLRFQAQQNYNYVSRANRIIKPNRNTVDKSEFKWKNLFFEIFGDFSGIFANKEIPEAEAPGITIISKLLNATVGIHQNAQMKLSPKRSFIMILLSSYNVKWYPRGAGSGDSVILHKTEL